MKEAFFSFKDLFSFQDNQEFARTRELCMKSISWKVPIEDATILDNDISEAEILRTIKIFSNGKAPGIGVYEVFPIGSLGNNTNRSIIKFIPKGGDKILIKNWRPITLLNVSYKTWLKFLLLD